MILDLYARLEQRSWLDMLRLPLLMGISVLLAVASFSVGAASAQERGFRFTETTGRAVIMDADLQQEARLMALEEALYLAALEGGASINGFSAVMSDTAIEDHFVVRPASRILDYTITNEVIGEQHYEVTIRAAIGSLPQAACKTRRTINATVFKPRISQAPNTPAVAGPMAVQTMASLIESIDSQPRMNVRLATETVLDPARLARANDEYDYKALTSGVVRVRRGDVAIIPEIALRGSRQQSSVQRRDIMTATLTLHLFAGESYDPLDSFVAEVDMTTRNHGIFRTINVLNDPSRAELLAALKAPIRGLVRRMANSVQCAPLTAQLSLAGATLTVPVGSHHGMRQNALAVATGTDTPWQIMRVTSVDEMQSTLTPLNKNRDIARLAGRTVEFMEIPQ